MSMDNVNFKTIFLKKQNWFLLLSCIVAFIKCRAESEPAVAVQQFLYYKRKATMGFLANVLVTELFLWTLLSCSGFTQDNPKQNKFEF